MALIIDPDQLNQGTEITIDTGARTFTLNEAGNLSSDGVTLQVIYSFFKEEWKNDATLIPHPFPMTSITPEQFEFIEDWTPANDSTRKLIRTGGWKEIDNLNVTQAEYAGVISLGTFEDGTNDLAYYQPGNDPTDTNAAIDFDFAGPVNEPVKIFDNVTSADSVTGFAITSNNTITRNDGGDWIAEGYVVGGEIVIANAEDAGNNGNWEIQSLTSGVLVVVGTPLTNNAADTTMTAGFSYRNRLKLFLRVRDADPEGKTYAQAELNDIGVSEIQNQVYRFPLSNATDLKITATDNDISSNTPYTEIETRYFSASFNREVDTTALRSFGIVIDVGTHSGVDATITSGSTTVTTNEGGIPSTIFDSGSLTIHEGFNTGSFSVVGTTPTSIDLSSPLSNTDSFVSFTLQRTTPVVATAEEIYEKIQFLLRSASDIDSTGDVVTGRTADELLTFVGDTLVAGRSIPNNPNGGGSGVAIEGFDSNDTNRITFTDNGETERTFPFVAAGSVGFNSNLVNDSDPEFWMFFEYTTRTSVADGAISGASLTSASLTSSAGDLPALNDDDFINISGFANEVNNGIWEVDDPSPTSTSVDLVKTNGDTVVNEGATSINVDENPFESDDALIVQDNNGSDISGAVLAASRTFDFDYDGNTQGGRTAGTDAAIVIVAIGLETAQYVTTNGTITRATGLSFNVVSGLERNYNNP